jgi:DNA-binding CsgD family transcriptional regulator
MRDLEPLIEDIYASALQPALWPATLGSIAAITGSRDALMQGVAFSPEGAQPLFIVSHQIADEEIARHALVVSEVGEPRVGYLTRAQFGTIYGDESFISDSEIRRHPYYQDLLAPLGYRYFAGFIAVREQVGDRVTVMGYGLQRTPRQGQVDNEDLQIFQLLAPHLARAMRIARRMDPNFPLPAAPMPDRDGCFGLSATGRVVRLNDQAQACLLSGVAALNKHGHLQLGGAATDRRLYRAIRAASERRLDVPLTGRFIHGQDSWSFFVAPVPYAADAASNDGGERVAIEVRVRRAPGVVNLNPLTPTEERLIARLERGARLRDAAADMAISYETARTHIKRAMVKLGVHSQAGLVARWLQVSGLSRS